MLISIIITTMNRPNILARRSLASALRQNFEDYEVLVIDGSSDNKTEEVVKIHQKEFPNLRYVKIKAKGLSHARNFGWSVSVGSYVVFLDDDNELLPDFCRKTYDAIKGIPMEKVAAVSVSKLIKHIDFEDYAESSTNKFQSIDWGWLFDRKLFYVLKYDEKMQANEDMDFGIRFFKKFNNVALKEVLGIAFDMEPPETSLSFPTKRELDGIEYFLKKNICEYKDKNELRYLYRLVGRKFYRGGYRLKGLKYFWKSFMTQKTIKTFAHFFFVLFGWKVYDTFMDFGEKIESKKRMKKLK